MAKLTCIAVDVEQALYVAVVNHVGHTVRADEEDVIDEKVAGEFLHVDKCCGASCTDTVGDGIRVALVTIEGGKRVINTKLFKHTIAKTVDTAVAAVYPIGTTLVEKQSDECCAHIMIGFVVPSL